MSATNLEITKFKEKLREAYGAIEFDGNTLGGASMIFLANRSVQSKPFTEIHIFGGMLKSVYVESKLNKRIQQIVVRIVSLAVGADDAENREEQAQNDLDELTELIMGETEKLHNDPVWSPGILNINDLTFNPINYGVNYYSKQMILSVEKFINLPV